TRWTRLYLGPGGTLSPTQPVQGGEAHFHNDPDLPPGQLPPAITFKTEPFAADLEVTGPVAFRFHATLDQSDATWVATLRDIAPDGTSRTLTKGWLRASQRELDEERSKPYRPWQKHTRKEALRPGQSYAYEMEVREVSNLFRAGHCLALDIRGQDSTAEDPIWVHTCNAVATRHSVQFGGTFESCLLLP